MSPEDVQLYYQIAIGGRRDLAMAPEPRSGFEMTLLRMLAFRPETDVNMSAAAPRAGRAPPATSTAVVPPAASPARVSGIDAANWASVVDGANLSGMARQFALNCVPASFDGQTLRLQFDATAAHRRTPQIEEKLTSGLSAYVGKAIRIAYESSESALITPARQRAIADQDLMTRAVAAFEDDAVVRGLRERFGAQIDAASVKPTN
jgi:DNA polymerase-3 subunit gamma/tau